jgi:hypothetical protein
MLRAMRAGQRRMDGAFQDRALFEPILSSASATDGGSVPLCPDHLLMDGALMDGALMDLMDGAGATDRDAL